MQSSKKIKSSVGSLVRKLMTGQVSTDQKLFIEGSSSLRPPPVTPAATKTTPAITGVMASLTKEGPARSAMDLVSPELKDMFNEIHTDLDAELTGDTELKALSK